MEGAHSLEESKQPMLPSQPDAEKAEDKPKDYEYDDLLRMVGGFGRFPLLLYAFTCVVSVPVGVQQLVQVFYGATPAFSCVSSSNETCGVRECCASCERYEFHIAMTSAVSEVRPQNPQIVVQR